jgi:hypothetical protein
MNATTIPIASAASCGSCTLCCKVLRVNELAKPYGSWCPHCVRVGGGCSIYDERPTSCREFECIWLQSQSKRAPLPAGLKPNSSHVVLSIGNDEKTLVAHVDPGYPDAWKQSEIGRWLRNIVLSGNFDVVIACGSKRHAFLRGERPHSYDETEPL